MTIFRHDSDTEGGESVLVVLPDYKPCRKTPPGKEFRARALEMGDGGLRCPGCDNICLLPQAIGPGGEFVVFRHPKRKDLAKS